jgi:hypothetical protein
MRVYVNCTCKTLQRLIEFVGISNTLSGRR